MQLSIFSRLMLGYLALLVIVTAVSVYATLQLGQMREITQTIILHDNALIDRHKKMTDALLSETRNEKKFVILRDRALYEGFLASTGDFKKYLDEAMGLADSTEVKDVLVRAEDRHRAYQKLFAEEAAYLEAGRPYRKEWYSGEKERVVNEVVDALSQLRTLSQQSIFLKVRNLGETGARARTVAMVVTGTALLFGIALSLGITRSITAPLSQMKKKTGEVAEGVFEADLNIPSPPEIGALARDFNLMCARLKEVDRLKSDFYALMSHELRTPLTSIREGTNLFLEGVGGKVTDKQRKLLTIIAEESDRLIELVNSLLDLSKLEAGVLRFDFVETDLSPLVARSVREVAPLIQAKNIGIESDVGEIPSVSADPERILQVLRNLIGNALKFTPRGGSVRIAVRRAEGGVKVSVTDTGPGIPEEEVPMVFEKYRQASPAGSRRFLGTGLGLAIVKHIVHAHGGTVWVESEEGCGSTFGFVLPA